MRAMFVLTCAILVGAGTDVGRVVGTLTCTVEGGEISDSSRNMRCSFKSISQGTDESYAGFIRRLNSGPSDAPAKPVTVLMWEVLSDRKTLEHGELAGRFVGAPAIVPGPQLLYKNPGRTPALRAINEPASSEASIAPTIIELDLTGARA